MSTPFKKITEKNSVVSSNTTEFDFKIYQPRNLSSFTQVHLPLIEPTLIVIPTAFA